DASETVPVEQLESGAVVEIGRFGTVATLLESPKGKTRVRVRVGEREMSVQVSSLTGLAAPATRSPQARQAGSTKPGVQIQRAADRAETQASEVDVRGRTAEEALELLIPALDRAMVDGMPSLRIIHGHGTGRLKKALRAYLSTSSYVASFRPG